MAHKPIKHSKTHTLCVEEHKGMGKKRGLIILVDMCEKCLGIGSTLPTECPGSKLTEHQKALISQGKLDFIDFLWSKTVSKYYSGVEYIPPFKMTRKLRKILERNLEPPAETSTGLSP